MTQLLVIRHLMTQDNLEQRFSCGERDIPLLESNLPYPLLKICQQLQSEPKLKLIHTGLIRTQQTAQVLANQLNYSSEILCRPEFRERLGGKLSGYTWPQIQSIYPNLQQPSDLWQIHDPTKNLESASEFLGRIETGLDRLKQFSSRLIILVAHAGSIKGIQAVTKTNSLPERILILQQPTPRNGQLIQFTL